jgi:hypothetical protein
MIAATLLALSALRAEDPDLVAQSVDLGSGTDNLLMPSDSADDAPSMDSAPTMGINPPTTPDEAQSLDQTLYGQDLALDQAPSEPDAQSRPWKVNLHASAGSYYDDNIFISPTGRQSDFVTLLSLGGGLILGDYTTRQDNYFVSDYTAIEEIFERHSNQDSFEQSASLQGQLVLAHLTLHANFELQDTADEDIDVGTRARRQIYTGQGSARYDVSDKTYLMATAQVTISDFAAYIGSNDERAGLSFNYLPDPNLTLGVGVLGGVLNVDNSASQTFEQLLASLQIAATGKFTFDASAGVEDRQTPDNNGFVTPVFQVDGNYKPIEGLNLTLSAYRRVINSAFYVGSDYIATGVSMGAKYELSERFTVLLEAGYMNADYRSVSAGAGISREDNFIYVRPALRYMASKYCNIDLYYFYRNDASTVRTSAFNDAQVGVSVNFSF